MNASVVKKSPIRRLRIVLNVALLVFVTIVGHNFYREWQREKVADQIVQTCQLPPLPENAKLHHSFYEKVDSGQVFVAISITAPVPEMDAWLAQVDQWQLSRPVNILSYSLRESRSTSRIDFSAEIATEPEDHRVATFRKPDTPAPPASR